MRYYPYLCAFFALFLCLLGNSEAEAAAERTVTVQPGMTLYQIARKYHLPVQRLAAYNHLQNPNLLRVGQQLHIPQQDDPSQRKHEQKIAANAFSRGQSLGHFTLTAYTAGPESTGKRAGDKDYGITATGEKAIDGLTVAVDPRIIPLGSRVYIEGIGYRVAQDTGSAIQGRRIDVFMNDSQEARSFGVQRQVHVELVD